jgi:hypothetical protein
MHDGGDGFAMGALDVKYMRRPMDAPEIKNVMVDVTPRAV